MAQITYRLIRSKDWLSKNTIYGSRDFKFECFIKLFQMGIV